MASYLPVSRAKLHLENPIYIDRKQRLTPEVQADLEKQMQDAFDQLDRQINPNYKYIVPPKPKNDEF